MAKHYREACYDPDCGICYPPIKPVNKPTLREPSGAKAERERILAIIRAVEEEADLDTEHGVGWSQACRSIDNRITQA